MLLLLVLLCLAAAAPQRLILSFVQSQQVRFVTDAQTEPLQLTWYYPEGPYVTPVGQTLITTSYAPGSYTVTELYLFDWDTFVYGTRLFFDLTLTSSSGVSRIGSSMVAYSELSGQGIVSYNLTQGTLGFRLVDVDATNAVSKQPFVLALQYASVSNVFGLKLGFPSFSFQCTTSAASTPNATVPYTSTTTTNVNLQGTDLKSFDKLSVTQVAALTWDPSKQGLTLVCSIVQNPSSSSFFTQMQRFYGVVALNLTQFPESTTPYGVTYNSVPAGNFQVVVGPCSGCRSTTSTAASVVANAALAAFAVALALIF